MKQTIIVIALMLAILLVAGCTTKHSMPDTSTHDVMDEDEMNAMPCHQMPDGSWMGDCDTDQEMKEEMPGSSHDS